MAAFGRNFTGEDDENLPRFNHFIKELCPEAIETKKLMLPRKFVKTVRDELSREVCLEAPNGRIWIIWLTREPGDRNIVWLDSGFGEFLSFYSIGARHSLIFKYRGGSHFQVVVCDNAACEVAYPAEVLPVSSGEEDGSDDPEFDGEEADGEEEEEEEEEEEYHPGGANFRNGKGKQVEAENPSIRDVSAGQRNRGKQPCKAVHFSNPEIPSVLVVMKKLHIVHRRMYLPLEFADKYFPEDSVMVKLRACCEEVEGFLNETLVVAERDNHNTLYLRRRWGEFRTNNDLHEGDVCLLQLVDVKDKIFNVYVFRA